MTSADCDPSVADLFASDLGAVSLYRAVLPDDGPALPIP